jgi:cell division protein FtsZ
MIKIQRNQAAAPQHDVRLKIAGLGGAGCNVLDRLLLDGMPDTDLVAINTDAQALAGSVLTQKVPLGRTTTRGLGAGGDPELGYAAAEESLADIRSAIEGAQVVFLCVGLGGGTGSGGARIVASLAREQKALVVTFATLPFGFEGKRRRSQADEALAAVQRYSDVVIHFENDRMGDAVAPLAGIQEAFVSADQTLSQSIRALASLVRQRGLISIGFDEIVTALRGANESGAHCVFGYGEATGDNRAHEALAAALKNPLMDKGRMLEDARNILVNIAGGPSMTLNEVQILMEELNRHISDQTRLLFGAAVNPALGQRMTVTILSALTGDVPALVEAAPRHIPRVEPAPVAREVAPRPPEPAPESAIIVEITPDPMPAPFAGVVEPEPAPESIAREIAPEPTPAPEPVSLFPEAAPEPVRPAASARPAKSKPAQARQEQMQFEPVTRGRFEKSEPTIVDGQDLDVPTFLRRNVKVK